MQLVAEKLVDAVANYFSDEIKKTTSEIKKTLSSQNQIEGAEGAAVECLHSLLHYHTWRLCHKTFVYEFHVYRKEQGYPVDPASSKVFDEYVSKLDETVVGDWFEKYQFLKQMVTNAVRNSCDFLEEVCQHLSQDAALLVSRGFIKPHETLKAIIPLDSDPHNGSRVNLSLEFGTTTKVLYKARSLAIDEVMIEVFSDILKFEEFTDHAPIPRTIHRAGYGWQEFIHRSSITDRETAQAYYNLGICAAVFSCLGATDLHDENILFKGVFPYFVDLETTLQPSYKRTQTLPDLMEERITCSIANTSVIPAKQLTIPHEVLIGAINTPYAQETNEMVFTLKHPGTDAIDLAKEKITVTRTTVPITLNDNQAPDPLPHQRDFLEGYSLGYKRVLEVRRSICEKLVEKECSLRVVIRPTVQYYFLLDACLFPENLKDEQAIDRVLGYLKPPKFVRDPQLALTTFEEEKKSLKAGDIPHFSIHLDDTRLRSVGYVSEGIFDLSPAQQAISRLQGLTEENLLQDQRLIAEGFSEIRLHASKHTKVEDIGHMSPLFTDVLDQVTPEDPSALIKLLTDLAVTTPGLETVSETGWIGGVYGDIPISYDSIALISLHDTGGILFLTHHLEDYEGSRYSELYKQSVRGIERLRNSFSSHLATGPKSIISGLSSLEFVRNTHSLRMREVEEVALNAAAEPASVGDVFIGATGMGAVLATFPESSPQVLSQLRASIQAQHEVDPLPSQGIAHGVLGTLWTQFRLAAALDDRDTCLTLFEQTKQFEFPATANSTGWCNGNAGLLMVLAEMAAVLKLPIEFYDLAKKTTLLPKERPLDLSVCHGAAGVLQSLLAAYRSTEDTRLLEMANGYWADALKHAQTKGFYTGEKNRDYLLGYFLGWSGVADSALILKMYNEGKTPWIPLNLSSAHYQNHLLKTSFTNEEHLQQA